LRPTSPITKSMAGTISIEESTHAAYDAQNKENLIEKTTEEQDAKYKTKEAAYRDKSVMLRTLNQTWQPSKLNLRQCWSVGRNSTRNVMRLQRRTENTLEELDVKCKTKEAAGLGKSVVEVT